ncbi:MAG: hypothetical protein ACK5PC_16880 [Cyclobacteriaceae bacterium]
MKIGKLSKEEQKKLAEAFSKSPVMVKKRKAAEKFFNSPQFLEFLKQKSEMRKKRMKKNSRRKSQNDSKSKQLPLKRYHK